MDSGGKTTFIKENRFHNLDKRFDNGIESHVVWLNHKMSSYSAPFQNDDNELLHVSTMLLNNEDTKIYAYKLRHIILK